MEVLPIPEGRVDGLNDKELKGEDMPCRDPEGKGAVNSTVKTHQRKVIVQHTTTYRLFRQHSSDLPQAYSFQPQCPADAVLGPRVSRHSKREVPLSIQCRLPWISKCFHSGDRILLCFLNHQLLPSHPNQDLQSHHRPHNPHHSNHPSRRCASRLP